MRPVFPLEVCVGGLWQGGGDAFHGKKTIRWTFSDVEGWQWFVYNVKSGAAFTDGPTIQVFTKAYGVWLT